jgi:hypothetical protein
MKKIKKVFCVLKNEKTWCYFASIIVFWFETLYIYLKIVRVYTRNERVQTYRGRRGIHAQSIYRWNV